MNIEDIPTPYYIVYEDALRRNFELITKIGHRSGAQIIVAFKANALWRTFPILRDYCRDCTASSLNELYLGVEELGGEIHSYSLAYTQCNIDAFVRHSTHITFNSLDQYARFGAKTRAAGVSCGLRVNPQYSVIETDIYNPAAPGSRLGVVASALINGLPKGIEGLHFHALCESSATDLAKVLSAFETKFAHLLPNIKWVNMGGGHLMTHCNYDTDSLISIIQAFRHRHPNLHVILEPGSAWTWQTGDLVCSVVDIVHNDGINTAILDASFACHMPDTLEMPYKPIAENEVDDGIPYRLGGNSCLSGDYKDGYHFKKPLVVGDRIVLKDMNHYTTVKTNMFNGIQHPDIILLTSAGEALRLRHFTYSDYKKRMC